ncbi:MAG: YeeE/YedE family protein [Pseudomonadales bacterium]|jgi:uncharacterized protein|nr:YeeE/YedE family protein [Pseudomonadales bacterium]MDP4766532.1 YeeE/YedE family protein [Pseudomonadales bacterium]MDP4875428.1 YeeE/YedE family protein [Pseudomonadales bacterium]MDP4911239.1 YeeE/YedE family protein [Pseudomonadales bacterium]MDP5059244.1 YeeE/YedE family protein [Pseudomonadales bacterium]
MSLPFLLSVLVAGALFGFGLSYATMIQPEVVLAFLRFEDFGLLWVLGSASLLTMLTYQLLPRLLKKPLLAPAFKAHAATLDRNTLVGAAIFGIGWGISGVCPGPALAGLGAGNWPMLLALAGIFAGAYVQGRLMK